MDKMTHQFGTDRLNSASAVFDEKKLKWFNATYLRSLPPDKLWDRLVPFFDKEGLDLPDDPHWRKAALEVTKTSMETLTDAIDLIQTTFKKTFRDP